MKISVWSFFLVLILALVFLSLSSVSGAGILFLDKFDQKLNTAAWSPNNDGVYTENGVLVLDQVGSGEDKVEVRTIDVFPDCVIYYQYIFAARSGDGDGGGYLRQNPDGDGGYKIRWKWGGGNNVRLTDGVDHPPIGSWDPFPGMESDFPATTTRFEFKVSLVTPVIKIHINDLDTGDSIAEWEMEDDWYESGMLEFDIYKDGVYHIDNVIVATPDMEETIFSDQFSPETIESAVEAFGKLATTWSRIKSQ